MNYTIYIGDDLIYNRRFYDEHGRLPYNVIEPVLSETTDAFNSLTYQCIKGTPAYDLSIPVTSRVKVREDGRLYWMGRVLNAQTSIDNTKTVYCEDMLGLLNDAIYGPFEFNGPANELLENIVNSFNSVVTPEQQIVDVVSDVDENVIRASEGYATCWATIKEKLLDTLGGYMWMSYDQDERPILHYSMEPRNYSTQKIQFGRNLKNFNVKRDFETFYTAIYPLGAKDSETAEYVTISSVNDGVPYLIDQTNAERYGIIFAPPEETYWEDVHEPSILLQRARTWIQNKSSRLVEQITLSGLDLSALHVDESAIRWLDGVECISDEFDQVFVLTSVTRSLDNPSAIQISMGDSVSITNANITERASIRNRIGYIEQNYVLNEDLSGYATTQDLQALATETLTNITSIRQDVDGIILSALEEYARTSDIEELRTAISSQLQIVADRIEAVFESTTESITTVAGREQTDINTIYSFIRLLPTTQSQEGGIVIGESTSQIKLKLENDILYFFTGDETTVSTQNALAYFSSGKLYVSESQITVLSIGLEGAMMHFSIVGSGAKQCLFLSPRRID